MRLLMISILLAACGSGDNMTTVDAAHALDATGSGSGSGSGSGCAMHRTLYLAAAGGHYAPGNDDSRTNTSTILSSAADLPAYPNTDFDAVKACIVAGLAGFPVDVTDVDPGTAEHVELVFTTQVPGVTSAPGIASAGCTARPNGVAFIAGTNIHNTPAVCGVALGLFGVTEGLDYTSDAHDFMNFNVCTSGCSFADAQETCDSGSPGMCLCSTTGMEDTATKLRAALCN
jgi:hypothetical protein